MKSGLILLVALVALGCQATSHHDWKAAQFTHSVNFGQGEVDGETSQISSEGLSVPGEKMVSTVLDLGVGAATALMPGFIGNALKPSSAPAAASAPQEVVIRVEQGAASQ